MALAKILFSVLPESAEKACRTAIKAAPGYAPAHNKLGLLLHIERKDVDGAEKAYRAAIEADPGYADANYNIGRLLEYKRGDFRGAEKAYRAAFAADPFDVEAKEAAARCRVAFLAARSTEGKKKSRA